MNKKNHIVITEQFYSAQGEGCFTGIPSLWLRTFGCNLKCQGFSQKDPKDPSTWINPIQFDPKSIKRLEDFPISTVGCDTRYSIDAKFKHLSRKLSYDEIINNFIKLSPDGLFDSIDICYTGGEPLLWQNELVELSLRILNNSSVHGVPNRFQIETNSTQDIDTCFIELRSFIEEFNKTNSKKCKGVHFNISPKLFSVSGEKDRVDIENILNMYSLQGQAILKFVVNETQDCWDELDSVLAVLKNNTRYKNMIDAGIPPIPVFCMPVGSTKEQQEDSTILTKIAEQILKRKLNITGRLHVNIFGNTVNT